MGSQPDGERTVRALMQSLRAPEVSLVPALALAPPPGHLLIASQASVLSSGTERMVVDFAKASLLGKVIQQPARLRQVADKVRTDGVAAAMDVVKTRLDEPVALGYANAGIVLSVGTGVEGFAVGDLVASNGPHAEVVTVPATLCARVPAGVAPADAAFASLGSIALNAIRLSGASLGDRVGVVGLGLLGLLTAQLLRAQGCTVLGLDVREDRLAQAASWGVEVTSSAGDPTPAALEVSSGSGLDAVIVAASSPSNDVMHQAAQMARKRGRLVLIGVTGLDLQREDFYEKELTFQVACSYGPGRHDVGYERYAVDYPVDLVRWTAARNFEAVLDLLASGRLDVASLVTHRFDFDDAATAYRTLSEDTKAMAIVLEYPEQPVAVTPARPRRSDTAAAPRTVARPKVAVIGSGRFASSVVLPALKELGVTPAVIVSSNTATARWTADRFEIPDVSGDTGAAFDDPSIDTVIVLTRHDSHARLVGDAVRAGKHVYVEKPLAISNDGLRQVLAAVDEVATPPIVGIGFNRRFAPATVAMTERLRYVAAPRTVQIVVNAGTLPADHWLVDPSVGGGRIVGECCHFVDLARHLADSPITTVTSSSGSAHDPSIVITLGHENGSLSSVAYVTNGSKKYPKEHVLVFCAGQVIANNNFRSVHVTGGGRGGRKQFLRQDKGHIAGISAFLAAVRGETSYPISLDEIAEVTAATLLAAGRS